MHINAFHELLQFTCISKSVAPFRNVEILELPFCSVVSFCPPEITEQFLLFTMKDQNLFSVDYTLHVSDVIDSVN